jgi:hypothetical protein
MPAIKKRYLVDENNRRVGVLLDLPTFRRIEELLEDKLFGPILEEAAREKPLPLDAARSRYARIKKRR